MRIVYVMSSDSVVIWVGVKARSPRGLVRPSPCRSVYIILHEDLKQLFVSQESGVAREDANELHRRGVRVDTVPKVYMMVGITSFAHAKKSERWGKRKA